MTVDPSTSSPLASASDGMVESPPAPASFPVESLSLPADLLDGGEVVILAIKPSLWSIVFGSFQWVVAGAIFVMIGTFAATPAFVAGATFIQAILAIVGLRVGFGILQWVSRVYVLTNRRVMRIRGVFRADIFAAPLTKVLNTGVTVAPHESIARLGSIWFNTGEDRVDGSWYHVAKPDAVHGEIRRAIERTLDQQH